MKYMRKKEGAAKANQHNYFSVLVLLLRRPLSSQQSNFCVKYENRLINCSIIFFFYWKIDKWEEMEH